MRRGLRAARLRVGGRNRLVPVASACAMVMPMSQLEMGSRSDLEALRRSGRGKFVLVALLLIAALGAAGWWFLVRKQGTGNPEDPAKVIVVGGSRGLSIVLTEGGFDAAEGSFEAWVSKAHDEVPELEVDGIEAIMELADRFGYGYVVFERPQEVDFSALDIDGGVPDLPEHVRFAVLSAGDFGFPHVMTVNPEPSKVMHGTGVVLLQALFEQKALGATLQPEDSASMADLKLRDQLRDAVDQLQRIPEAEKLADKIVHEVDRQLADAELAEPKPHRLGAALESVRPVPLANGQILGISRGFQVVSRDAMSADLDLEDEERFILADVAAGAGAPSACDAIAGGKINVHESPRYWFGNEGDAVLLQTLSEGLVLWTLEDEATGCAFIRAGELPAPTPGLSSDALPHGSGRVARAGEAGGQAVVSVVDARTGDEQLLGMLDAASFAHMTWLDARRIAAIARRDDEVDMLVLLDVERPTRVVTIPATIFENASGLGEVARVQSGGEHPVLAVTAGGHPRRLYRLDLPMALDALFESAAPRAEPAGEGAGDLAGDFGGAERPGMPTLVTPPLHLFTATALTTEGEAFAPSASPDGKLLAFVLADSGLDERNPGDSEIAVVAADAGGKGLRLLTRNALRDYGPRFTADGSHVVFETRVEIPKTEWRITAARAVSAK